MSDKPKAPSTSKWKNWMIVDIYRGARAGLSQEIIAQGLGVTPMALSLWKRDKPSVAYALEEGKYDHENKPNEIGTTDNFLDYCFGKLPPEMRQYWEEIDMWSDEPDAFDRTASLLKDKGKLVHQHLFVHAVVAKNFDINKAMQCVCVSAQTYKKWLLDADFNMLMDAVNDHRKNFLEASLFHLVKEKNPQAVIFANKTLNSDRGYGDKTTVKHEGTVNHSLDVIPFDELELSVDCLREIRDAQEKYRKKRAAAIEQKQVIDV